MIQVLPQHQCLQYKPTDCHIPPPSDRGIYMINTDLPTPSPSDRGIYMFNTDLALREITTIYNLGQHNLGIH